MTSLLLSRCRLLAAMDDERQELADVSIAIEDGWVTQVGDIPDHSFDQVIDCRHHVAIPGLVNTHHHLYQTLTRGFPASSGRSLFQWLQMLYPIWSGLDEEMIYDSTRTGLAELALSGCTTTTDHLYVFPASSGQFMDRQIEAARSIGLRFHPTRGSMDRGASDGGLPPNEVVQSRDVILRESERVIREYHDPTPGSMVRIALAPCSPFSATPELMRDTADLARSQSVRLHTHIAETMDEDAYSRQEFGMSPVELLQSFSWLEDDVWLAHCVHANGSDIQAMTATGVCVAHCPTSNMLLGSGLAPIREFLDASIGVGLGVDGSASNDSNDMKNEVKQAVLTARVRGDISSMPVRDALWMATRGGARCLGRNDIGSIEVGKAADIVLFDADSLYCAGGQEDLISTVILTGVRPDTVIVNGRVVVQAGTLVTEDTTEIAARHSRSALRLMHRYEGTL